MSRTRCSVFSASDHVHELRDLAAPRDSEINALLMSVLASEQGTECEKKPGSSEPGLRYWPCEADTITFQEGLLSFRATGGGGQMRNANAQCANTMIRAGALRQPPAPHVSHAETGGWR